MINIVTMEQFKFRCLSDGVIHEIAPAGPKEPGLNLMKSTVRDPAEGRNTSRINPETY